jgi:precorrin-3B C17-methyltransferase
MMNRLYIISSGAGGESYISAEAREALRECEVVVSYVKYAKELKELLEGKEVITSGMTKEIQRCKEAIESALSGKTTAIISNGDVNVYGMATLIVEMVDEENLWERLEVRSLPGVTALLAVASKAGAPLSQDFAVVSLSDRLTDIEVIRRRVEAALEGDFVLGIYNPKSRSRVKPYEMFLERLANYPDGPVVVASNVGREREKIVYSSSRELVEAGVENPDMGMSTLLLVGNSNSRFTKNGKVLTPRGYFDKYDSAGELKGSRE